MLALRPEQLALLHLGLPLNPCNGGGGGGSSSSTNETTTNTTNIDKRQVVDAGSFGLATDSSTNNVTITSTDMGAVKAALDTVLKIVGGAGERYQSVSDAANKQALDFAGEVIDTSARLNTDVITRALEANDDQINAAFAAATQVGKQQLDGTRALITTVNDLGGQAFDLSANANNLVRTTLDQAISFAQDALAVSKENVALIDRTQAAISNAYQTATDTSSGNRSVILLGLLIGGVVAFQAVNRK